MGGETNNFGKEKMFKLDIVKQVRNNYALVPLVITIGFGSCLCAWQMLRTVWKSPDVIPNKVKNPKPYNNLEKDGQYKQYKYFSTLDYKSLSPDPDRPSLD